MRVKPHAVVVHEFDQPPGEPIEGGTADGSGLDQDRAPEVEALPPVIEPTEGGVDSDLHDTATGDGWVPA